MLERYFHLTCDYCGLEKLLKTNKFPPGWKWSHLIKDKAVKHRCPDCEAAGKGQGRIWKEGGKKK